MKETNLLSLDRKLLVSLIAYLSDFESKIDEKLQNKLSIAIDSHLQSFTTEELADLALHMDHYKEYKLLARLDTYELEDEKASNRLF